ncbi:hypothetical protein ACCO45_010342 [Purpureocillium lilacinum]|uniref:Uncharacterized protein n=1 Tax=Purpureocillium lilacinum TaxID=33203 RepID=A0ACC4DGS2_PURLI
MPSADSIVVAMRYKKGSVQRSNADSSFAGFQPRAQTSGSVAGAFLAPPLCVTTLASRTLASMSIDVV